MTEPTLTVVLCTHNPRADYLSRTLAGLAEQTLALADWELLIVDNLCDQPIAERRGLGWRADTRIVVEPKLGLTPARLRGIREARGELLVFVDDDNVLDPPYLEHAQRISAEHAFLGAWSGQCIGEFEAPPPEWTRRYWGNLCIRQFDQVIWSNLPRLPDTMPAGAGLCIRRSVAEHYLELHFSGRRSFQFDRRGSSLLSGGDNDLAACACRLGMGVGLFPQLRLLHLIPPQRLTAHYLARLAEAIAFSSVLLDAEWGLPTPVRSWFGQIVDQLRVLRLRGPHRKVLQAFYRGRDLGCRHASSSAGT